MYHVPREEYSRAKVQRYLPSRDPQAPGFNYLSPKCCFFNAGLVEDSSVRLLFECQHSPHAVARGSSLLNCSLHSNCSIFCSLFQPFLFQGARGKRAVLNPDVGMLLALPHAVTCCLFRFPFLVVSLSVTKSHRVSREGFVTGQVSLCIDRTAVSSAKGTERVKGGEGKAQSHGFRSCLP